MNLFQTSVKVPDQETEQKLKDNLDTYIEQAAQALQNADFLLFSTGAGWSADSGLSVYKDVADVECYQRRELTYADLCDPEWIEKDPEIFYGFWGSCFNDYREKKPHEGYQIVKRWRDALFQGDEVFTEVFKKNAEGFLEMLDEIEGKEESMYEKKHFETMPGRFFAYTSNVDHHNVIAGFNQNEVNEYHGNSEYWQCANSCCKKLWRAPEDFRFMLDEEMLAKVDEKEISHTENFGFNGNQPRCKECGYFSRPNVLMFGDWGYLEDPIGEDLQAAWHLSVEELLEKDPEKKIVILEIGCGDRITTSRRMSEAWALSFENATIIRVNPQFPLPDYPQVEDKVISIMNYGLDTVQRINALLEL